MPDFGMILNEATTVQSGLLSMQINRRADTTIIENLDHLVSFAAQKEEFWANASPSPTNFSIYHSWRNLRLIFSKMQIRFAQAPLVHDNPAVVDEARDIFPDIIVTIATLASIENDPTKVNSNRLLDLVSDLRQSARSVKMIDPNIELENVDREKLSQVFDRLAADDSA
ncbi:MAG: hypothetical protein ABSF09_13210 [Candidatus Bathyarchaeia archaeon]|jgi:hypothetical protein